MPADTEPGATSYQDFLAGISQAVDGTRLMLPVCPPGPPTALNWAAYTGELSIARYGLLEPIVSEENPAIDSSALSGVAAIIVPALAADATTGIRLGRGAGYYDRSLEFLHAPTAVVVYPEELIDELPYEAHDRAADAIIDARGIHTIVHG